ncbi:MAG: KEOPS complex kinase/ATPase Bud32 [Nanoarchaeota archaeon]|nr:KEOPS complex kinase/ATPase Bud32 [Nanoarchaeota archaeon]
MKVIAQGAEAIISLKKNIILKDRIKKSYRLPELDEKLRRIRTKKEVKLLEKASFLIPVPKVIKYNSSEIELEYIKGKKLAQYLNTSKNKSKIAKLIGENLAKLHDNNIIHGDLTTSNMIFKKRLAKQVQFKEEKVFFIDFGLGFESSRAEDKATDLHVLKEALEAKHYKYANQVWKAILKAYKKCSANSALTLKQLDKVESRGRYKAQY